LKYRPRAIVNSRIRYQALKLIDFTDCRLLYIFDSMKTTDPKRYKDDDNHSKANTKKYT